MTIRLFISALTISAAALICVAQIDDPARYVDPFIGTQGEGNTFPGAALPFGMVKLGPDCGDLTSNSGYRATGGVKGFSHTHVSGTGGGCKYGNILVAPFTTELPDPGTQFNRLAETASPGYFAMQLDNGVKAEMTVTPHAAIHRYTFGPGPHKGLSIEAGSLLGRYYGFDEAQNLIYSETEVVSPAEISGMVRLNGGWNMGGAFTVYFYAGFDRPACRYGTWIEGEEVHADSSLSTGDGRSTGAYFLFDGSDDTPVELRVGISYVSIAKARANCIAETAGKSFDAVLSSARDNWNEYLGRIKVSSDDEAELTKFYTALYHTFLQPIDKTGENAMWLSEAPYYDDFYCMWDTYRTSHPLYTLIARDREADIVNSLIDIYRHTGFMPDGRSGDSNGRTQGGSSADMVVAEAILKDIGNIDEELALEAMLKDAEADPGCFARRHGRGGITDYKRLGYVSTDYERSGVRTLEYAANDYAIALAAEKVGKSDVADKYRRRSANWQNLWKDVTFDGITGFIMPRTSSGEWDDTFSEPTWEYYARTPEYTLGITPYREIADSDRVGEAFTPWSRGSWVNVFYESDSWEYSLYAPHDMAGLIARCGGAEKFVERLDHFFDKGHYNINNEPGFLVPCLYIYAGRHDKATERIADILKRHYTTAPDGLPGNDDSGAMSSWYAFHKLGLFPVAGQDVYLLTAPHFSHAELTVAPGRSVDIRTHDISETNRYVQAVTVNGREWHKPWMSHAELTGASVIEFTMGPYPSDWFAGELPPSK